jgi:hypothetical protein
MAAEMTIEDVRSKDWVRDGDTVTERIGPENEMFAWQHDTVITSDQIQSAIQDPDVRVCDIEWGRHGLVVNLQAVGSAETADYPSWTLQALLEMCSLRFHQKQNDPKYGGWDEEDPYYHLGEANRQIDSMVDCDDALEQKEQIADAVNYLLFAYSIIDAQDS